MQMITQTKQIILLYSKVWMCVCMYVCKNEKDLNYQKGKGEYMGRFEKQKWEGGKDMIVLYHKNKKYFEKVL